jgi:hypothetical protein
MKKSKAPTRVPTGKARLECIEAAALEAGKQSATGKKSRLDHLEAGAQRAIRSGQRESDDATGDDDEEE